MYHFLGESLLRCPIYSTGTKLESVSLSFPTSPCHGVLHRHWYVSSENKYEVTNRGFEWSKEI